MKLDPIRVKLGQVFEIYQSANLTTGYEWTPIFNENMFELKNVSYETSPSGLGTGGQQKFFFVAKRKGTATVRFIYKRPWDASPSKESQREVVVE